MKHRQEKNHFTEHANLYVNSKQLSLPYTTALLGVSLLLSRKRLMYTPIPFAAMLFVSDMCPNTQFQRVTLDRNHTLKRQWSNDGVSWHSHGLSLGPLFHFNKNYQLLAQEENELFDHGNTPEIQHDYVVDYGWFHKVFKTNLLH
jgi:hypothetical protein